MTLLRELLTPSPRDEAASAFLAFALAHVALGAAAADVFGAWAWAFCLAYLVVKEGRDLMRGGGLLDGLADACFVALGAFVAAPIVWIAVALAVTIGRDVTR